MSFDLQIKQLLTIEIKAVFFFFRNSSCFTKKAKKRLRWNHWILCIIQHWDLYCMQSTLSIIVYNMKWLVGPHLTQEGSNIGWPLCTNQ